MRAKLVLMVASTAVSGALAPTLGVAAAGAKPKGTEVTCRVTLASVSKTTELGVGRCTKPFGQGVQYVNGKGTVSGSAITETGQFQQFFYTGTVYGTFKLAGSTTGPTLKGSVKYTGGTGAYKRAAGSGRLSCTSLSATGSATLCTVTSTLTGI